MNFNDTLKDTLSVNDKEELVEELNLLNAFKRVAETSEGKRVLDYILKETNLREDPFTNSGRTAYILGMQQVGRAIIDKLIQSDVTIDDFSIFSFIGKGRIAEINNLLKLR